MTDDEHAFLRAAAAEPDEDTLRLAYADYLDDRGGRGDGTLAAFVRLQVRRARTDPFDPDRPHLLEQESAALQKHQRAWNGRLHRLLRRRGFTGAVDARRGSLRGWGYHRGMVGRVTVAPDVLDTHADAVLALGPVAHLRFTTWPDHPVPGLPLLALIGLQVVSLPGPRAWGQVLNPDHLAALAAVPVLDLRAAGTRLNPATLLPLVRLNALSPVVLYRATVRTTHTQRYGGRTYELDQARDDPHVIDPHRKWDALRLRFADLTGELLTPVRYQGASR